MLIIFLAFLFLASGLADAQGALVPCGWEGTPCTFCHFFELFANIVNFVLFKFVPPLAVLMLTIGGAMFFLASGDPGKLQQAKGILTSVAIGLIFIYAAWLLVNLFFMTIGVAEWTGLAGGWFKFECQ